LELETQPLEFEFRQGFFLPSDHRSCPRRQVELLIKKVYNKKRLQGSWFMRRSRVVASACAAALLATSLAAPASANLTKRQKAEAAFANAVIDCVYFPSYLLPRGACDELFDFIKDKIAGR